MEAIVLILKYLPQALGLFQTVETIHAALPTHATVEDKVAAVQAVIQATHASAVANGETTASFEEYYNPISALISTFVGIFHSSAVSPLATAPTQPAASSDIMV